MVYDYHVVFAAAGSALGLLSFVFYFKDIFRGKTKPHIFTWIVWTLLTGLTSLIQFSEGGGAGAWVAGVESLSCLGVAVLSYTRGEKDITRVDWICFGAALLATGMWLLADQPLLAVLLVISADALGFAPTLRKSYTKPYEETVSMYTLSASHWIFSIIALQTLSLTTVLYPAVISLLDTTLVATLLIRRRQLAGRTNVYN
ncbi:hypothetical protein HY971_01600 [Candidatus Kaiserbacteria bacterium]|nr:hypothetical protein [Candidatus Kaiserbacteria bacterium]